MSEAPFHATRTGRTYDEHTLPELVRQLHESVERLIETQKPRGEPAPPEDCEDGKQGNTNG